MMQGDQYGIPFHITINGETVQPKDVDTVEITIGPFTKTELTYDVETGDWIYPMTQGESFRFGTYENVWVRVKFKGGNTIGKKVGKIDIEDSASKEVL